MLLHGVTPALLRYAAELRQSVDITPHAIEPMLMLLIL